MTTLALPARGPTPLVGALLARHRALGRFGLALIALAAAALVLEALDPRTLPGGDGVWVKPAKFFTSTGLFALTAAWFFGYVRPERRRAPLLRGAAFVLIAATTLELAWICWQAAQGLESHFNFDTEFYQRMFNLMGILAVLLIGTTLPLAWEIARRPALGLPPVFVTALVIGLVLTFLLGTWFGMATAMNGGHSVGLEGGRVPIFGWNRAGGDLRIAHFLGVHAEQAIPVLGALAAGLAAAPARWLALAGGTALYVALTYALYLEALAGRPLFPL